jgi:hypothetical protein
MASGNVGGLSGTFIPVSEDAGMIRAVRSGTLSLDKLEALTSVCSVGLDMFAVPGDTPPEIISSIIADELSIGVMNHKTTSVRIVPVPGAKPGSIVHFGGLLGSAPVMKVITKCSSASSSSVAAGSPRPSSPCGTEGLRKAGMVIRRIGNAVSTPGSHREFPRSIRPKMIDRVRSDGILLCRVLFLGTNWPSCMIGLGGHRWQGEG